MSRIPSTRVKKIPNSESIILTHVHIPLKKRITLGYGNQVFHILQYICQLFYLPLQNFKVRHPQSLHNYPTLHPTPPIETLWWVSSTPFGFPFIYLFNYRRSALVHLSFANDQFTRIPTTFHLQTLLVVVFRYKRMNFYTHLFCCIEMRFMFVSSTAILVTTSDTSSVASKARSQLTNSK